MIASGLRVFDIRDPEHPKEIAYYVAPPDRATGGPIIDERANCAMSAARVRRPSAARSGTPTAPAASTRCG